MVLDYKFYATADVVSALRETGVCALHCKPKNYSCDSQTVDFYTINLCSPFIVCVLPVHTADCIGSCSIDILHKYYV